MYPLGRTLFEFFSVNWGVYTIFLTGVESPSLVIEKDSALFFKFILEVIYL
jgi:hypothetical protein